MSDFRVRFAPSPTGALHIGGVRTALYNYLLAKQKGGTFILRIEDTDQTRYVEGAEVYIKEALKWCGLVLDEGPEVGGEYGPYRQSERKAIYKKYAEQLVASDHAYYAFDTPEALQAKREAYEAGKKTFRYDASVRMELDNSLSLGVDEVQKRLASGEPYTIRLKVPGNEIVFVQDEVRGEVSFKTSELDDKIMLKADGMPTYHLANIVDDHLMKITHVIRGEEWLPSTAHHVLLYRFMGWEDTMPKFAHLPLILKPNGKGKLSKRDGAKFGFPVFPLEWKGQQPADSFTGFREFGFLPEAVINFLAFLGWNPGTEQEIFSMEELIEAFSVAKIGKSGARFDIDKAKWFNQQYIASTPTVDLLPLVKKEAVAAGYQTSDAYLTQVIDLMKTRVQLIPEFISKATYLFEAVQEIEEKPVRKKWKADKRSHYERLVEVIETVEDFEPTTIKTTIMEFIASNNLKMGDMLQILRLTLSGTLKGPDVFSMAALLQKEEVLKRFDAAYKRFDEIVASKA